MTLFSFKNISLSSILTILLTPLLLQWSTPAAAHGYLQIRSFTPEVYDAAAQNWVIARDSIGRIYAGNPYGLLTFDGIQWGRIFPANYSTVRSLLYDNSSSRLYAGCSEDFGYFAPNDKTGELKYESLLPSFGKEKPQFSEVWNIMKGDSTIWFQTDHNIIEFDGKTSKSIKFGKRITTSNYFGGKLYLALEGMHIMAGADSRLLPLPGTQALSGTSVCSILPFGKDKMLITTREDGLYLYADHKLERLDSDISEYLIKNMVFCAAARDDNYIFGTVSGGAVIKNFRTGHTHFVNKDTGLPDNTVLYATFDTNGNVWLGLDNGIAYVLLNSPLTNLAGSVDGIGSGYAALRNADRLLLGTNQGLFSMPYQLHSNPAKTQMQREVSGQIWDISQIGNDIFIAGDGGLWIKSNGALYKVAAIGGTHKVAPISGSQNVMAACYDGFHLLRNIGGHWEDGGLIPGNKGVSGAFSIDERGNVWVNHWLKGIYRLHYDVHSNTFNSCTLYSTSNGLPDCSGNSIAILNGAPAISTRYGFYTWDPSADSITPHSLLASAIEEKRGEAIRVFKDSLLLLLSSRALRMADIDASGKFHNRSIPLLSPAGHIIPGFENLLPLSESEILIGNNQGFWICNTDKPLSTPYYPPVYVNTITANTDSLIFRAAMTGNEQPVRIPYSLNSLRIDLGTNILQTFPSSLKCSTMLENYEDDWEPFNSNFSREYTRLHEGKYRLLIRLQAGREDEIIETAFEFEILPPWYRTIWMKLIYVLLLIIGGYFAYKAALRWKRAAEKRVEERKEREMEQLRKDAAAEALQKDYEIAKLKSDQLEFDVKHKSGELSTATMNLMRKNEILTTMAGRIRSISVSPGVSTGARKELIRLAQDIDENISNDEVWDDFRTNFDIVYNNFNTRLHKEFPSLTVGDLRLCCYIKMGLSTKEIAPLLNISIKSVEMARYRVRRKLNLPTDSASLTEYIANY